MTRRRFGTLTGAALAAFALGGCRGTAATMNDGRITARPGNTAGRRVTPRPGVQPLKLGGERDAVLFIPAGPPSTPLPLLVLLHGAGGSGGNMLRRLGAAADVAGLAILSPDSRDPRTWDGVRGSLGPDVAFLNRALQQVFQILDADPQRISIGGFSDGASYAITLGLINGDLFTRVVAWSPGFYVDGPVNGRPRFYISHGRADEILPIDRCSRVIVPRLQKRGYEMTYREFDGGHSMPPDVIREGLQFGASPE